MSGETIGVSERDWKLFLKKLSEWQESYMEKLIPEYQQILNADEPASEKFWKLKERLDLDQQKKGVVLHDVRRSTMYEDIIQLIEEGVISLSDLDEFSEDVRDRMHSFFRCR